VKRRAINFEKAQLSNVFIPSLPEKPKDLWLAVDRKLDWKKLESAFGKKNNRPCQKYNNRSCSPIAEDGTRARNAHPDETPTKNKSV
jgi:hypothetical protein